MHTPLNVTFTKVFMLMKMKLVSSVTSQEVTVVFQVGICRKLLASHVFLEMELPGHEIRPIWRVVHSLQAVVL